MTNFRRHTNEAWSNSCIVFSNWSIRTLISIIHSVPRHACSLFLNILQVARWCAKKGFLNMQQLCVRHLIYSTFFFILITKYSFYLHMFGPLNSIQDVRDGIASGGVTRYYHLFTSHSSINKPSLIPHSSSSSTTHISINENASMGI